MATKTKNKQSVRLHNPSDYSAFLSEAEIQRLVKVISDGSAKASKTKASARAFLRRAGIPARPNADENE